MSDDVGDDNDMREPAVAGSTSVGLRGSLAGVDQKVLNRRVRLSIVSQIAGQLASSALGIVIVKVITSGLGLRGYGVYATATTFVLTFALLTDLGLNTVTAREIAQRPDRAEQVISDNLGLRLTLTVVMIPVLYGLAFLFYPGSNGTLRTAVLFAAVFLPFESLRSIAGAYFTAHVLNVGTAAILLGQQVVLLALAFAAASCSASAIWYVGAFVAGWAVAGAVMALRLWRRISPKFRLAPTAWPAIISASVSVGSLQVISVLYLRADGVIISVVDSPAAAGVYAIANLLISSVYALASYVMTALVPTLANESNEHIAAIVRKAVQMLAALGCAIATIGIVCAHSLVVLVSDSEFSGAAAPFRILIVANIFTGLITIVSYACVYAENHRPMVLVTSVSFAINIVLNVLLIRPFGLNGAAAATLVCELGMFAGALRALRAQVGLKLNVFGDVARPLLAAILATAASAFVVSHIALTHTRIIDLAVEACVALLIYVVIALTVCRQPLSWRALFGSRLGLQRNLRGRGMHRR